MRDQRDGLRAWMAEHANEAAPPLLPGDIDPRWEHLDASGMPCAARHPGGVFCTLDQLHDGWHVAHQTGGVVLASWLIDDTGGMHTVFKGSDL